QKPLEDSKLTPRTLHALRGSDGRQRYSGVWGKTPSAAVTTESVRDLFEENFATEQVKRSDQWLVDAAVSAASRPSTVAERARAGRGDRPGARGAVLGAQERARGHRPALRRRPRLGPRLPGRRQEGRGPGACAGGPRRRPAQGPGPERRRRLRPDGRGSRAR